MTEMPDWSDWADNAKKCYDVGIEALRERLERSKVVIGEATLYNEDCNFVLPTLGKVDGIITDPPYPNLKGGTVHRVSGIARKKRKSVAVGDTWEADLAWVALAENLPTKLMAVFCSHANVADFKNACSLEAVTLAVWHKRNAPPAVCNVPRQTAEFIWLFKAGPNVKWRSITDTVFSVLSANAGCVTTGERIVEMDGRASHPTQKPLAIMAPLVALLEPNATVLDPFMGSGTTGVACIRRGQRFIGIERDPKHFATACRRIEEAYKQPDLFVSSPEVKPEQMTLV